MEYIHVFDTQLAHDAAHTRLSQDYTEPWLGYAKDTELVSYNLPHDYANDFLTFKALSSGTFGHNGTTVYYSTDQGETWTQLAAGGTFLVANGDVVLWKDAALDSSTTSHGTFTGTANFEAYGNFESLIDGDTFTELTVQDRANNIGFTQLFAGSNIVTAENLAFASPVAYLGYYASMFSDCTLLKYPPTIPSQGLNEYCYMGMFSGCTSLVAAPELPATTLAAYCYSQMFSGCTKLRELPATLPATTPASSCYSSMFYGCTSMTSAPAIMLASLSSGSCASMFTNCSRLSYIKAMFLTTPTAQLMQGWVDGVAATGTFVKSSSAQWNVTGIHGVPDNWTIQTAS